MQAISLRPIGYVRSRYSTAGDVPTGGGPAAVVLDPALVDGLHGIERVSHLFVMGWRPDANPLIVRPLRPRAGWVQSDGVFASRCASRPNPLSLSVVRLVERRGNELLVEGLDLADGSPVLDLRPYLPGRDAVFAARRPPCSDATPPGEEALARILERHLGDDARRPEARLALRAVARAACELQIDPRDPAMRCSVNRTDVTLDVVLGLLGATFASHRVRILPSAGPLTFRFVVRGAGLELREPSAPRGAEPSPLVVARLFELDEAA